MSLKLSPPATATKKFASSISRKQMFMSINLRLSFRKGTSFAMKESKRRTAMLLGK
jgi:hypothetical protein